MDKIYSMVLMLLIFDTTISYSYSIDDLEKTVNSKDYVILDTMLEENNENINSQTNNQNKYLLLQIAIRNKDINSIVVLLKHGADLHKSNI